MFVLVIGALVGLGIYYGVPWAYRRLVWPVQDNRARVAVLEQRMDLDQEHLQERDRALQDRVSQLETELESVDSELAGLREQATVQAQDQQTLEEHIAQLEAGLEAQQQEIKTVAVEMQSSLGDETADLNGQIEDLEMRLGDIVSNVALQAEETRGELDGAYAQLGGLEGRLALLQTAQDLVKVRLLLLEENPGTARDTLDLAIVHLDQASALMPSQAETLEDLRNRITGLDDLIARGSFRARPDLESLWAAVMDLVVPLSSQSTVTATGTTSPLPTPTPSP
jgi:chromosome segregation ATPase